MKLPRRRILRATGTIATATTAVATAGCQTLTQPQQLLVVENETDSAHRVTVTVRRPPSGTTTASSGTTTSGKSPRFVVDFRYDVPAGDSHRGPGVLPTDGEYVVLATTQGLEPGRGRYVDTESVRVRLTNDGITVEAFTPS
jgi:hypothetical protein